MLNSSVSVFRKNFLAIAMGLTLFLFGVFVVLWFYVFNRYSVLYYQEQMQLFRFDRFYFFSCLDRPGGLSEYFGAFLTQFYYYPLAGAMILTAVITTVVWLFYLICKTPPQSSPQGRESRSCGNIHQMFFIPFIPAILLMISFVNNFFDMSAALGIFFVLAGFKWYITMPLRARYVTGMLLVTAIYFIAGGNALLLAALILIFEVLPPTFQIEVERSPKEPAKKRNQWLYLFLLAGWSALLPVLSWRLIYTVTMREAYFALTPVTFIFPNIDSILLWISIPVLFLIWRLEAGKTSRWNFSSVKVGVFNFLLVFLLTVSCAYTGYDYKSSTINRMTFDLQQSNFDSAIAVGKDNPSNNRLICYLTNIALYESGQMPYRMFHYKQIGLTGLFLDWESASANMLVWYLGEVYYRFGMMLPAEHCAFEALVLHQKKGSAKVLQRLALTHIARRDQATAYKYLRYLDHSLFYRKWTRQQSKNLDLAMSDINFQIPDTPLPVHCNDFYIPYRMPEYTMLMLLETNPKHRMAFEYLMAYCMLQRDLEKVKWCVDKYYRNFDYPTMPTHYEEALLLYKNMYEESPDFLTQFSISLATQERYNRYMQAIKTTQASKSKLEQFQKQFGNTFWYYMNRIDPATLKK